jgi:hypothetical protein
VQELLPTDCRLPIGVNHLHQLPVAKAFLGCLPPTHQNDQTAAADGPCSQCTDRTAETGAVPTRPKSAPPAVESPVPPVLEASEPVPAGLEALEQVNRSAAKDEAAKPPPVVKATSTSAPCGLRKLPPRSKRTSETISRCPPVLATDATNGHLVQHRNGHSSSHITSDFVPCQGHQQAMFGFMRMCCTRVEELIATWPARVWCPAPSAWQVQALLHAVAAAVHGHESATPADCKFVALAAKDAAMRSGLSDEALVYILSTFSAPGCQQACHELIWNEDARFRACALRLPVPNFSLAGVSSSSVNSWVLLQAASSSATPLAGTSVDGTASSQASSAGATYMEPPPRDFDIEHPQMQVWADRVAADVVSRRKKECESVKVQNHLSTTSLSIQLAWQLYSISFLSVHSFTLVQSDFLQRFVVSVSTVHPGSQNCECRWYSPRSSHILGLETILTSP